MRLLSGPQSRTSASTPLDARDSDRNHTIWNARLVLATTGLHLAQFRHKHRPLAKAVDYAELFIYDEAQQEAAFSDIAILGALPRKCLLLRLGDPRQTSGGTGPGRLAQEVHAVSDELSLGIRSARQPLLPQELPHLVQTLLIDDLPPLPEPLPHRPSMSQGPEGGLPIGGPPSDPGNRPAIADRTDIQHALLHAVTADDPGTGPKALTLVLVSLRHMIGASRCRCHSESNRAFTRSWP